MKILIVDDCKDLQCFMVEILGDLGYKDTLTCESGKEALEIVQSSTIDLVLLDWSMPEMSGLETLKILKSMDQKKHIPVIMVTGDGDLDHVKAAIEIGAEGYILKPINKELLHIKVEDISKNQRIRFKN